MVYSLEKGNESETILGWYLFGSVPELYLSLPPFI